MNGKLYFEENNYERITGVILYGSLFYQTTKVGHAL